MNQLSRTAVTRHIRVEVDTRRCAYVLVPNGITTPYDTISNLSIEGGDIDRVLTEDSLGLNASLVRPRADRMTISYRVDRAARGAVYPAAAFKVRKNRFTHAAQTLARHSQRLAQQAGGGRAGMQALVREAETLFAYAHPEHRFNDGLDEVPHLSCAMTPGSCVDINTYLVASLRAAGYEAAYFYGYFFPEDRGGFARDGHCWVVTRHDGEILEWDIAHHLKADLGPTQPGLNPRPGQRVAISHSMGHVYAGVNARQGLKVLGEPLALDVHCVPMDTGLSIRLTPWL